MIKNKFFILLALVSMAAPAFAADDFVVKDAFGVNKTKRARDTTGAGGPLADANNILDPAFNVIDPSIKSLQGCVVVSGDQALTVGATVQPTCTTTGRLRTGLSSAGLIAPSAPPASQTAADLSGCVYRASPVTFADGNTGAIACNADGSLKTGWVAPPIGAATFTPTQATVSGVSGTPTLIVAARTGVTGTGRVSVTIENESTAVVRICSTSACTSGVMLPGIVGSSITLNVTSPIYGFVASGSAAVSAAEIY